MDFLVMVASQRSTDICGQAIGGQEGRGVVGSDKRIHWKNRGNCSGLNSIRWEYDFWDKAN